MRNINPSVILALENGNMEVDVPFYCTKHQRLGPNQMQNAIEKDIMGAAERTAARAATDGNLNDAGLPIATTSFFHASKPVTIDIGKESIVFGLLCIIFSCILLFL